MKFPQGAVLQARFRSGKRVVTMFGNKVTACTCGCTWYPRKTEACSHIVDVLDFIERG